MKDREEVMLYLTACPFFTGKIIERIDGLTGGLINFVYRISFDDKHSVVLKHYPPFIATLGEDVPFSQDRYVVEKTALQIVPASLLTSKNINVPKLLYFDDTSKILVMEDIGTHPKSLFSICLNENRTLNFPVKTFVNTMWCFLKDIQYSFRGIPAADDIFRNEASLKMLNEYIIPLYPSQAKAYNLEKELAVYLASAKPFKVPVDNYVLTIGDLWPNSIYWNDQTESFYVIDWEVSRFQEEFQDIKQLLCNLWVMRNNPSLFNCQLNDEIVFEFQNIWLGDGNMDWRLQDQESKNYFILFILTLLNEKHWQIDDPASVMKEATEFK